MEAAPSGTGRKLRLTVRNTGRNAVTNYRGGQQADFWVENQSGDVIWLWSDQVAAEGSAFTEELLRERFPAGDSKGAEATWDGSTCDVDAARTAPPGVYVARALWVSAPRSGGGGDTRSWWSPPVKFEFK